VLPRVEPALKSYVEVVVRLCGSNNGEKEDGLVSKSRVSNARRGQCQQERQIRCTYEILVTNTVNLDLKCQRSLGEEILLEEIYNRRNPSAEKWRTLKQPMKRRLRNK